MELPKRKPMRLPQHDYSAPGAYFITVCTKDRACILSEITVGAAAPGGPRVQLTDAGKIVEQYILSTDRMPGVRVDKYVVMPNHVHMILVIVGGSPGKSAPTVPDAVGALKRLVDRTLGRNIWQRSFYEHVIRNEGDYREIWEYIDANPARWAEERYYQP